MHYWSIKLTTTFDPHSRDNNGKPVDSSACVLLHFNVKECCTHIERLGQAVSCDQYEYTVIEASILFHFNDQLHIIVQENEKRTVRSTHKKRMWTLIHNS